MRRIIVLAGLAPALLLGLMTAGPTNATALTPAPAASPPNGDEHYTAAQLTRGLPAPADLPAGWTTVAGESGSAAGTEMFASGICNGGFPITIGESVTYAWRTFRHTDGSTVTMTVRATGAARAREIVAFAAEASTGCAADGARYTRLALPEIGDDRAGFSRSQQYGAAVAAGVVSVVVEGSGGKPKRFVRVVKAGTKLIGRIGAPPGVAELQRGLVGVTDLPPGYRLVADATGANRDWFTEFDCAGRPVAFGPEGTAVRRTLTRGQDGPVVQVTVGSIGAGPAAGLVAAVRQRLATCPDLTGRPSVSDLPVPATDITVAGAVYRATPPVARTVVVYRDIAMEFRITGYADVEEARGIVEAGMGRIFQINS